MFSAHFFFWKGVGVGENPNCWISPVVVTPVVPSWNAGNSHPCWCCTNVWHVDSVIPVICSLALTLFEPFWPLIQLDLIDWLIVETHLCHACSIHPGRHGKMIDDPHWLSKIKRQAAVCSSTRSCISRFQESIFVQSPKASFDAPGREVNILEAQTWYDSDADTPPTVVFPVSHDYQNLWGLMLDEFPDPKQKHFCWISIQFGGFNYISFPYLSVSNQHPHWLTLRRWNHQPVWKFGEKQTDLCALALH